jgi:hypothetical protein
LGFRLCLINLPTIASDIAFFADERDKSFFKPLRDYYDVVFLDDFIPVLAGINSKYQHE